MFRTTSKRKDFEKVTERLTHQKYKNERHLKNRDNLLTSWKN